MTDNIHQLLRDNFGPDSLKLCRDLEKTARKISNWRNHLRFNVRCLHNGLTPVSVKLKTCIKGHRANNIIRNAEKKLLNERVRSVNFTIDVLNNKFKDIKQELKSILPEDVYNQVIDFVHRVQSSQHQTTKERQVNKFKRLKENVHASRSDLDKNWRANSVCNKDIKDKWVKNLSDRELSDSETSLLCKGLGYAVTSKKVPIVDIITTTESAIKQAHLELGKAEELRQKVNSAIRNSKPPPSNLPKRSVHL